MMKFQTLDTCKCCLEAALVNEEKYCPSCYEEVNE